jgi:hypothetical protein
MLKRDNDKINNYKISLNQQKERVNSNKKHHE